MAEETKDFDADSHRINKCPAVADCPKPDQNGAQVIGTVCRVPRVLRTCVCNAQNAFVKRHGVKAPLVDDAFLVFALAFAEHVSRELRSYYDDEDVTFMTWLHSWPEAKRNAIISSILDHDPVVPDRVKCMVKLEIYLKFMEKARLIQFYINMATQAAYAPEFRAFQAASHRLLRSYRYGTVTLTFGCGLNSLGLGQWLSEAITEFGDSAVFYERDGKNWDSTMQAPHMEFRAHLLRACNPDLADFAVRGFAVRGSMKTEAGPFTYRSTGTVKSGHNDTSSGNTWVNLCVAAYAAIKLGYTMHIIAVGDDMLAVAGKGFDGRRFADVEATCGIVPEYRVFHDWRDVTFISACFWRTKAGIYFATPLPGRLLAKFFATVRHVSPRHVEDRLHSQITGMLTVCHSLPIIGDFLRAHDTNGKLVKTDKFIYHFDVHVDYERCDVYEDWVYRYGAPPSIVFTGRPGLLLHPYLEDVVNRDCDGLEVRGEWWEEAGVGAAKDGLRTSGLAGGLSS